MRGRIAQLFKKYGWKLGVAVFLGYLMRDVALYIVLPYLIVRSLI